MHVCKVLSLFSSLLKQKRACKVVNSRSQTFEALRSAYLLEPRVSQEDPTAHQNTCKAPCKKATFAVPWSLWIRSAWAVHDAVPSFVDSEIDHPVILDPPTNSTFVFSFIDCIVHNKLKNKFIHSFIHSFIIIYTMQT